MKFGSVCSGIEAASVAWNWMGLEAAWFSEIETFPSAVLSQHYPNVPNLGDMTTLVKKLYSFEIEAPDILCGGTPCQAFSVAGLRKSLDDPRGNLSLTFCEIANAIDTVRAFAGKSPCVIFWENVPGVLNTTDNAFGCFLAALAGEDDPLIAPGGRWKNAGCVFGPQRAIAWRVLDAQYFGVAQRRRRVYVVASARDRFNPAEVLFEFDGLRRDTAPSREAWQTVAPTLDARAGRSGETTFATSGGLIPEIARCDTTREGSSQDYETTTMVPVAYRTAGDVVAPLTTGTDSCANIMAFDTTQVTSVANRSNPQAGDPCHPLAAGAHAPAIAIQGTSINRSDTAGPAGPGYDESGVGYTLTKNDVHAVATPMAVRRLTPMECERLQGFNDDYTLVQNRGKPAADGPRYKALGNSWAVPVVRWIGWRILLQLL